MGGKAFPVGQAGLSQLNNGINIALPYQFEPRMYQRKFWNFMQQGGKRAVIVWHRRAGKDLTCLHTAITLMMKRRGLYWHLLPTYKQGRKIVWDGFTSEGKKFLEAFPKELIDGQPRKDLMQITLKNGSIYQVVGTDDVDSLVGSNPCGVIFSEYSLQNPAAWNLIRPILAENGGWAIFVYTARGRNHGYDLLQSAKKNPNWFSQVLTVDDTKKLLLGDDGEPMYNPDGSKIFIPVINKEVINEDRASGMPEELIQQEYWCSFDAPLVGSYYGQHMLQALEEGRFTKVPYDQGKLVHTAWDIGIGDHNVIWYFQLDGKNINIIDYEEGNGKSLADWIKICKDKPYDYGTHLGPHDLKVREYTTKKTRLQAAKELGVKFTVVPKLPVADGIDAVRKLLGRCWFDVSHERDGENIILTRDSDSAYKYVGKCDQGVECLRQYTKEWDDAKKLFRDKPLHNWASHGSDAFRILATGLNLIKNNSNPVHSQTKAKTDYDVIPDRSGRIQVAKSDYDIF